MSETAESVIARAADEYGEGFPHEVAVAVIAALDAAGYAVVPKEGLAIFMQAISDPENQPNQFGISADSAKIIISMLASTKP